jgi:peptidoglycan-associated lipoprotein
MSSKHRAFALLAVAACHHDAAKTTTTVSTTVPPPPATKTETPPVQQTEETRPVSTNLSAGGDLVAACKLHFDNAGEAPKFDFDHFELTSEDRGVLEQVAACVTTGPLAGKRLHLVGRADPRGTEEYNLGLGDRRAHTVESYLERLGLTGKQVATTTRGALDATGTDEATWRADRRVDLELAN